MLQRFINDPNEVVDDMLVGFCAAEHDLVRTSSNPRVLVSTEPTDGRVAIVTGGGSGHEPAFLGYRGPAREVARLMVDSVLGELEAVPGDDLLVLLSGLGGTTALERYILFGEVKAAVNDAGHSSCVTPGSVTTSPRWRCLGPR